MRLPALICVAATLASASFAADAPEPIFYLPLDGSATAAIAGGEPRPRPTSYGDMILALVAADNPHFKPGKVGQSYDIDGAPLVFDAKGNFRPDEGACSFWLAPNFRGDNKAIYCTFFGAEKWGMLYKYLSHTSLTFGTAKPTRDLYYDCNVRDINSWRPGEWHHVAATWSRRRNARCIYVDGKLQARAPFPFHRAFTDGPLFVGGGCLLYPSHHAHGRMDEAAIWDHPLNAAEIRTVFELGQAGKPLRPAHSAPNDATAGRNRLNVVQTPAQPKPSLPVDVTETRADIRLDGPWAFLPAKHKLTRLPATGWGSASVPGYFTSRDNVTGPDGKPAGGRWQGTPLREFRMAYYQQRFRLPAEWKGRQVLLHFEGVDGLAAIYVNGRRAGTLLCWEDEDYAISDLVKWGQENIVTVALQPHGGGRASGIYGSITVQAAASALVRDIVVRPRVDRQEIELSCDLWRGAGAGEYRLAFEIAHASAPGQVVKRFSRACQLAHKDSGSRALSLQAQRIECRFPWPDARQWTYDDPHLYVVRAKLYRGDTCVDESPPYRFGFREFTQRGSDFYLNGVRTHLRGHQINLAWPHQLEWMEDFKVAGMNCVEVAGPFSSTWYGNTPYRKRLFEDILDFADENGILAIPCLPAAKVLKDQIFKPEVARLYRRRVEKHIRRYGNHASIGMWYMDFNLAGYRWYHPPTKIDGSYKPSSAAWRKKERYSLEAQRIAQSVDPRPIYHHACGNFGDIYTLNCYIGPTSPLQEREEWPSRWAKKRPFPLVACEHGLWLVPYWFRPRQFPLSVVYSGEPIFDELSAMMLGPRAYRMVTPKLFDAYGLDGKQHRNRLRQLIAEHPGYQEVKSLIARRSLRAWRTYGVNGIIYNAIQWDFRDAQGKPLPVLRAQQRYFGHTDFYIAGPKADFPSKDHAYWSGEQLRKQIVLLNDLTHDVQDMLDVEVRDATGAVHWSAARAVVFRAGAPTHAPLSYALPEVAKRTEFTITVRSLRHKDQEDHMRIQVFPRPKPVQLGGRLLLYDPIGDTKRMLDQAGVSCHTFDAGSRLASARAVVVGRKCYDEKFVALARRTRLEDAVVNGLNLLVLEQTRGDVMGLRLTERSTRRAFIAWRGQPALRGLSDKDFVNLKGASDLIQPYPEAPPETEKKWPKRYFKWGNRGIVATFVYIKPHYAPFVPMLHSGYDLVESPLMQARIGKGRVVLCQVDVASRYGADPVSTTLVDNLLRYVTGEPKSALGKQVQLMSVADAVRTEGLALKRERFFAGRVNRHPLLAGLCDGDLYLKQWREQPVAMPGNGWRVIAEPGLVAVKETARGLLVVCTLAPASLGKTRGRVKALRFRNTLLSNLGQISPEWRKFISHPPAAYEPNPWEEMPGYINW